MDLREQFLMNVQNRLATCFEADDLARISGAIIVELSQYQLTERIEELAIRDNSNDRLLEMYGGVLLTEGKSKRTVREYLALLRRFAGAIGKNLTDASVFDIRIWLALMQKQASLRSCENYRSYLSAFYNWMMKEEIIQKNPMLKITPIKFQQEVKLPFSDVEIDALRSACQTLRERAELELMLSSGARVSEVAGLDRTDVNLATLDVIIREGKGGKGRTTYINDVARLHLQRYISSRTDACPCMFLTRNGDRIEKGSIERDMRKLGARAGVENVHPHRFRRTFATGLAKRGMDVRSIQILMGHTNLNTTMHYISLDKEHLKTEYKRFA